MLVPPDNGVWTAPVVDHGPYRRPVPRRLPRPEQHHDRLAIDAVVVAIIVAARVVVALGEVAVVVVVVAGTSILAMLLIGAGAHAHRQQRGDGKAYDANVAKSKDRRASISIDKAAQFTLRPSDKQKAWVLVLGERGA